MHHYAINSKEIINPYFFNIIEWSVRLLSVILSAKNLTIFLKSFKPKITNQIHLAKEK